MRFCSGFGCCTGVLVNMMRLGDMEISFLGHSGFMMRYKNRSMNVYIDPYRIGPKPAPAQLILISHPHKDHCSIEDLRKISNDKTVILSSYGCSIPGVRFKEHIMVGIGEKVKAGDLIIESVRAYNTNKTFHPKANDWLGFILNYQDKRIYFAGDTDVIPEMRNLGRIDVAMVPVTQAYTMGPEEAAVACNHINPRIAIPIHYGVLVGTVEDAMRFKECCKVRAEILETE